MKMKFFGLFRACLVALTVLHLWMTATSASETSVVVKSKLSNNPILNSGKTSVAVVFDVSVPISEEDILKQRDAYELAIVLDVSGSMEGPKLDKSKQAVKSFIDTMIEGDIIHIVTYDHNSQVIYANGKFSNKEAMLAVVDDIVAGGMTNMMSGVDTAYDLLKRGDMVMDRRMFLFSDGWLNVGETDTNSIVRSIGNMFEESSVVTSSFGVGTNFDRILMTSIPNSGMGDFFYIEKPEVLKKIVSIAQKDVESVFAKNAILKLNIPTANQKLSIHISDMFGRGEIQCDESCQSNLVMLKDLRKGDTKSIVVELSVETDFDDDTLETVSLLDWELKYTPRSASNEDETQSMKGSVRIDVISDASKVEQSGDAAVIALWRLAQIRDSDRLILADFESGETIENVKERKMDTLEMYDDLQQFIDKSGDSIDDRTRKTIQVQKRRLENTASSFSSGGASREILLLQSQNDVILNEEMSEVHDEL